MKRILQPLFVLLALVACAGLVAACGGLSKTQYQKQVKKIMDKVEKDGKNVFSSSNPTEADFKKAEKLINQAADDLDDISPPSDVKDLHKSMIEDIRTLADAMPKFGKAMAALQKDPSKAESMMKDLESEQKKVQKATERMEKTRLAFVKKGYTAFKEK